MKDKRVTQDDLFVEYLRIDIYICDDDEGSDSQTHTNKETNLPIKETY